MTRLLIVLLATLLAAGSPAHAATDADRLPSQTLDQQVLWDPIVEMGGELYPSLLIATATMEQWGGGPRMLYQDTYAGDALGQLGAYVQVPVARSVVRVEVSIPGLAEPSAIDVTLPQTGVRYEIFPRMVYNYGVLQNMRPGPVNVVFRLWVNGTFLAQQTRTVRTRSLNDVPLWGVHRSGSAEDYTWMFAAFVNESHPWVDELLGEALQTGIVNSFAGYQQPPNQVYAEVAAIWNSFQRRGFRYSNITTPSGVGRIMTSQHVRTFEESVRTSQANCADGSVLFASMLRKIGVDPILILLPGHMMVGFFADAQHTVFIPLETTMMGTASFQDAHAAAVERYNAALPAIRAQQPGYAMIDVDQMRQAGVMPIGR
jgi:hypothetical protein